MAEERIPTDFSRTQPPRERWLALADPELPIEPLLPIVDTHMHLWHRPGHRYFVEDFAKDVAESGHRIDATLFIECNSMYRATGPEHLKAIGEIEFAVGQAAIAASKKYTSTRVAAGIIGYAALDRPDLLDEVLDAQIAAANGRLRGIRQRAKWDPDPAVTGGTTGTAAPGLYLEAAFQRGLRSVAARGLIFEASIYHPQISDVTALARAVPDAKIVIIHSGSPLGYGSYRCREREVHNNWLRDMKECAACPNVSIKLGGMLMTLAAFDFNLADKPITSVDLATCWRPYVEPLIELFGVDRCMASSNFPVDKAGFTYGTVWNMFKRITAGCSADEKQAVYSTNACLTYGIDQ
jgi:predicted TIM-barrel fold metal-dependent hydrolase